MAVDRTILRSILGGLLILISIDPARAQVRDVTPPGFTRSQRGAPDSMGSAQRRPATLSPTGVLSSDGKVLQLYGVSLPNRTKICTDGSGAKWACGQRAIAALRQLLDRETISCELKSEAEPALAVCTSANKNIGGLGPDNNYRGHALKRVHAGLLPFDRQCSVQDVRHDHHVD